VSRISDSVAGFWRNSRDWSLAWQLVIAVLVVLVGALVAASISDALYGAGSDNGANHTREPTTTVVTRPTPPSASATQRLVLLRIASPSHEDSYNRAADFGGWVDVDGCKDTRAELLIRTSAVTVTFTRASQCTVKTGRWSDPWSGVTTTVAHEFQIDHTVPLANAWRSGAWSWTNQQRVAYANDLADRRHLVPMLASENESKSDRGPDEWKPPNPGAWCAYARVWDRIKVKWNLSATQAEWNALVAMVATC
jgi:hypothetical protein